MRIPPAQLDLKGINNPATEIMTSKNQRAGWYLPDPCFNSAAAIQLIMALQRYPAPISRLRFRQEVIGTREDPDLQVCCKHSSDRPPEP